MTGDKLKFYFDEGVQLAVSEQLRSQGIDAISVRSLNLLGDTDINHLMRAAEMERVLCTYDADYLRLHASGISHAGIMYAAQSKTTIGDWVRAIRQLHDETTSDLMIDQILYV